MSNNLANVNISQFIGSLEDVIHSRTNALTLVQEEARRTAPLVQDEALLNLCITLL